jgi:uncharacterized SAM-binding protein YcdF (DUF218 family)
MFVPAAQAQLVADDLNVLSEFLAENDFPDNRLTQQSVTRVLGTWPADVLVLLGNSVLGVSEKAFAAVRDGAARRLLIAGGLGHSTHFLYEALNKHPRYSQISVQGRPEAELLLEIATRFHGINARMIVTETESSNCGENAQFTLRTLLEQQIPTESIILVQDPTMQRRSCASFEKAWQDVGLELQIANYPAHVPEVRAEAGELNFANVGVAGLWNMRRFVSLLLGEVPRLRDDENGYGPQGRGYIVHVDVPDQVLAARQRLASVFPEMSR